MMDNTSKPRVFEDQFTELSVGGGTGRISEVASMSMVVVDGQLEGAHLGSTCDRNRAICMKVNRGQKSKQCKRTGVKTITTGSHQLKL